MTVEAKGPQRGEQEPGHRVELESRRRLTVTGVREVLRFDETLVVLQMADRLLAVRGEGLTLRQLAPQEGRVEVRGMVDGLSYEQSGQSRSWRRRLFG